MIWVDDEYRQWRVKRVGQRWQLSLWSPENNMWRWLDDFSTKAAAIDAAREDLP
jgi:hypothetical protein